LEGTPVAPQATVTELLLKLQLLTFKYDSATLFAYTAPPPPLAMPGRTEVELESAEPSRKLEFKIRTVTFVPAKASALGGKSEPSENRDNWGEWSSANAPPYPEEDPRELDADPPVNDTAEHLENQLLVKVMWTLRAVVVPVVVVNEPATPFELKM
jgi:hypothetical protein